MMVGMPGTPAAVPPQEGERLVGVGAAASPIAPDLTVSSGKLLLKPVPQNLVSLGQTCLPIRAVPAGHS